MKFLKQVKVEIKNIIKSKFIMIIGIILLAAAIAVPIINSIASNRNHNGGPTIYYDMAYDMSVSSVYEGGNGDSITVDGVTITSENPFFWNLRNLTEEKGYMSSGSIQFSSPLTLDTMLELMDMQIAHYLRLAVIITTYDDYRTDIAWQTDQYIIDKFMYEHGDTDPKVLLEVMQFRMGMEEAAFNEKYINITAEQRLAALDDTQTKLDHIYEIIDNNDFEQYVQLMIELQNDNVAEYEDQIALHEKTIVENPDQEEYLNSMIEDLNRQIEMIKTNTIPIWEYRLDKNIIPNDGSWQNAAISDMESNRNQLVYIKLLTEEEFNKERYLVEEYGSYLKYKDATQAQIDDANEKILIAQNSLEAEKPDMKFVTDGARNKTVSFLDYSIFIALFGILIGGWVIAREFSQGTIRLLMIRPKTRTKIIMSKFIAALAVILAIYLLGCLLNIAANGIVRGFADFGFPNFTATGEVSFFAYYVPKFLACIITILLGYTTAFMLSTVTKNTAVSVIVPVVIFIGSYIGTNMLTYSRGVDWLAYTPIPYVQISSFFSQWSPVNTLMKRGVPINLTYGIIMLLVLSALFTFIAVWVFRKKDITK